MTIYRKIYESYYGPIPTDENGRTYEIHHIDGDRLNNDISNLQCVTIEEHFNIHASQGDWAACLLISQRMKMSPQERSELSRKASLYHVKRRVIEGTHHFLGGEIQRNAQKRRVKNGTHHWQSGEIQRATQNKLVRAGTHHFLGGEIQREANRKRVEAGIHPFQNKELAKQRTRKQLADGKHSSQIKIKCSHCSKTVSSANYKRWHGDSCRLKPKTTL